LTVHELPLERRTLHGHFSRDLEPVLTLDSGDTVRLAALESGWHLEPGRYFEPRDAELDGGHALSGPIEVRGARAGETLEVRIGELRAGPWGATPTWQDGELHVLLWTIDADAATAREEGGHAVGLDPFLGVLGMPPPERGRHSTVPPRRWGGNLDCKELTTGTTLLLPIPVDGALFSAGDGHARQGDGEVGGVAIECPLELAELTLAVRDDLALETPIAWTPEAWIALGLADDLDEAARAAVEAMLALMERELGVGRRDALALASVVVDLRVTQIVNGVKGIHAVLRHDALR
jgi:acetamidase/formamidase